MIPARIASLPLGCFLHPAPSNSAAESPKIRLARFTSVAFLTPREKSFVNLTRYELRWEPLEGC